MIGLNGIIINNRFKNKPKFIDETHILYEKIEYKNIYIERRTLRKFLDDKIFIESNEFIIALEGVIFNKADLIKKYTRKTWEQCIIEMYEKNGETFYNEFRGSFSGFFFDKGTEIRIIFTDHIGDKPIYYFKDNETIVFASEINYIIKLWIDNNIDFSLDDRGVYSLLTQGYMLEDLTPFDKIRKLKAGSYIKVKNDTLEINRYHLLSNIPDDNLTDKEIISQIDILFKQAMLRQINKNKEYGYNNIAPLSAGLDSRMTTWVLSQKVKNILNVTYSQSNYLDETIPKEISSELRTDWTFKTLDNGLSLFYLDEMVKRNSGVVLYPGPAQVWDSFHLLDHKKTGVIHTGMLGDVVVGTFYKSLEKLAKFRIEDGAYSKRLFNRFEKDLGGYQIEEYKNQEIFNFYNRGFNGANMGAPLVFQEFGESYSPFYDIDFLEFCLTIPVKKRWKNYIYDKWIIEKYPEAAKYAHNGRKISKTKGREFKLFSKTFTISEFRKKMTDIFTMKVKSMGTSNHMNPFDYWYNTNNELKNYMDEYYYKNIDLIETDELKNDIKEMYEKGNTSEKTQVLTLLSIVQNYFHNTDWLKN